MSHREEAKDLVKGVLVISKYPSLR
jgi:hypothetical protein